MRPDAIIFVFGMLHFKSAISLSSFTLIKRLFSSSSLSAIRVVSSVYLRLLIYYVIFLSGFFHLAHMFSSFCSVPSLSCVQLFVTPWTAVCQVSLCITNSRSLPKLMSVMPSNHLNLYSSAYWNWAYMSTVLIKQSNAINNVFVLKCSDSFLTFCTICHG